MLPSPKVKWQLKRLKGVDSASKAENKANKNVATFVDGDEDQRAGISVKAEDFKDNRYDEGSSTGNYPRQSGFSQEDPTLFSSSSTLSSSEPSLSQHVANIRGAREIECRYDGDDFVDVSLGDSDSENQDRSNEYGGGESRNSQEKGGCMGDFCCFGRGLGLRGCSNNKVSSDVIPAVQRYDGYIGIDMDVFKESPPIKKSDEISGEPSTSNNETQRESQQWGWCIGNLRCSNRQVVSDIIPTSTQNNDHGDEGIRIGGQVRPQFVDQGPINQVWGQRVEGNADSCQGSYECRNRRTALNRAQMSQDNHFGSGENIQGIADVESETVVIRPSKFLKMHYNIMYFLGVSTYNLLRRLEKRNWVQMVLAMIQKVFFWLLSCASLFHSLCNGKFNFLYFLFDSSYSKFIQFVFYIVTILSQVFAINLFAFRNKKTDKMFETMENYENTYPTKYSAGITWKMTVLNILLATLSFLFAILTALFAVGFTEWSMETLMLQNSIVLSQDIFIWAPGNIRNTTTLLTNQYGKNQTTTTISFGSILLFRNIASYLLIGMLLNLVIIVGLVMSLFVMPVMKEIKEVSENVPMENFAEWLNLQRRREEVWLKLRALKGVVKSINAVYNPLLKLMHIGNLLMYVLFLVLFIFTEDKSGLLILFYAYNTVKAEVAYYIAGRIAEQNDVVRTWVRNWAMYTGSIRVGDQEIQLLAILDELNKDPIGLGEGNSVIHHTFHFKLLGFVMSVFFSMADDYMVAED